MPDRGVMTDSSAPPRRADASRPSVVASALAALVTVPLVASCGGSGGTAAVSSAAPSRPPRDAAATCPAAVGAAVARSLGSAGAPSPSPRATRDGPGVVTCGYRVGAQRVRVTIDRAPQAAARFSRAVVERGQVYDAGDPRERPVQLDGVGAGADWIPGPRELLATAGDRLVTVKLLGRAPARAAPADRPAAAIARAALRGGPSPRATSAPTGP
jgi:hypothetical protein